MEVSDRKVRILGHTKGSKLVLRGSGFPTKTDGRNGDIIMRTTKYGMTFMCKSGGVWYYTVMQPIGS